jgi:hypothetical protein
MIDILRQHEYERFHRVHSTQSHWPDARKALDEYCDLKPIPALCFTAGQGVIIKRESLA